MNDFRVLPPPRSSACCFFNSFNLLTKAFFIPIISNMFAALICTERFVDGEMVTVLASMQTLECGTGWQPWLSVL